jgi:hypothetical protein
MTSSQAVINSVSTGTHDRRSETGMGMERGREFRTSVVFGMEMRMHCGSLD